MTSQAFKRVLVSSTPGMGHLQALMPLALALRDAGHEVLWATARQARPHLANHGFPVVPAGMDVADRWAAFGPRMPEVMALPPRQRRALFFSGFFADAAAPAMHRDLAPIIDTFRPHVVVHEMAELAAAPMAISRGLPHVTVAFSGTLPEPAVPMLLDRLTPVWAAAGAGPPTWEAVCGDLYLHPFPPSFGWAPNLPAVRPLRPQTLPVAGGEAPTWLEAFGRDRPGVYLTSGTEVAAAQAPWNAMFAALDGLPLDVVATTGALVDTSAFTGVPTNVRIETFVPHQAILERAALVMSHAGAGTLLAAAARGLPQLLFPLAADQWENADAIAGAGAALVCEPDARSAADLRVAIETVLNSSAMKSAAAGVAAEIAAMPSAADHVDEIVGLAMRPSTRMGAVWPRR